MDNPKDSTPALVLQPRVSNTNPFNDQPLVHADTCNCPATISPAVNPLAYLSETRGVVWTLHGALVTI